MTPRTWLGVLLCTAWRSPVDHPREGLLILSARMAVLWGCVTIMVTLTLIAAIIRRLT